MARIDGRRIKTHHLYTADEAAERLGVHPQTVRNWEKKGLRPIDDKRPRLYLGTDIKSFTKSAREKLKQKCASDEMYCFKCRQPRRPAFDTVELHECKNGGNGNLRALCSTCGSLMRQHAGDSKIAAFELIYTVEYKQEESTL